MSFMKSVMGWLLIGQLMMTGSGAAFAQMVESTDSPEALAQMVEQMGPALPFIATVEGRLFPGETQRASLPIHQRLEAIQIKQFGSKVYSDPFQLIDKLTQLYPQEAQTAFGAGGTTTASATDASTGIEQTVPTPEVTTSSPVIYGSVSTQGADPTQTYPSPYVTGNPMMGYPGAATALTPSIMTQPYNTYLTGGPAIAPVPVQAPNPVESVKKVAMKRVGTGLMNFAMMAGTMAGNYFLQKKFGMLPNGTPNAAMMAYPTYFVGNGTAYSMPYTTPTYPTTTPVYTTAATPYDATGGYSPAGVPGF
jgi:hypothetical protein